MKTKTNSNPKCNPSVYSLFQSNKARLHSKLLQGVKKTLCSKTPFLAYKWLGSNTQEFQEDKHTMTNPRVPKDKQEKHKNKKC